MNGSTVVTETVRAVARPLLRAWLGLRVEGAEHVPATGGVLLAATHTSHADAIAIGAALPRRVAFLGSAHLAAMPVLGALLPRLGMVPVHRGVADAALLDRLAELVRAGEALVVFPEGSRSRDGRVHRPRSGVARLAAATGAPVVPIGLSGTAAAWPVDDRPRLRRGAHATLRVGPAMAPPGRTPLARREFTDALHQRLASLAERPASGTLAPVGGAA